MTLTVPADVVVPSAAAMKILCYVGCISGSVKIAWDSGKRILTLSEGFGTIYLQKGSTI